MVVLKEKKIEKKVDKETEEKVDKFKEFTEFKENIKKLFFWNLTGLLIIPLYLIMMIGAFVGNILVLVGGVLCFGWGVFIAIMQVYYMLRIIRS